MAPVVNVNPPFTQLYLEIQKLAGEALVAATKDDVESLHKINHQLLGHGINLAQFSFFGLTLKKIQEQAKVQQADQPDQPPV